jgi:HK97 gp10 family phage protein
MEIAVSLTGLDALLRTLVHDLPEAVQVPVLRRALIEAAEPIRAGMAARAPRGPDAPHIADAIITKPLAPGELEAVTDDSAGVEIGPRKEFFYGYFWEFGTNRPGWVARPFARPAFDAHQDETIDRIGASLGAAILQAAEKHKA